MNLSEGEHVIMHAWHKTFFAVMWSCSQLVIHPISTIIFCNHHRHFFFIHLIYFSFFLIFSLVGMSVLCVCTLHTKAQILLLLLLFCFTFASFLPLPFLFVCCIFPFFFYSFHFLFSLVGISVLCVYMIAQVLFLIFTFSSLLPLPFFFICILTLQRYYFDPSKRIYIFCPSEFCILTS